MKSFLTLMDTIKTSDGKVILYRTDHISNFFKKTFEENYMNLSKEEKEEVFIIEQEYGDILIKMWKEPLHNLLNPSSGIGWILQDTPRNPTEEYEYALSIPKDEDMTEEEHSMKMERLRLHKEWFESQND